VHQQGWAGAPARVGSMMVAIGVAGALVGGCGSGSGQGPWAGVYAGREDAPARGAEARNLYEQAAIDLESALSSVNGAAPAPGAAADGQVDSQAQVGPPLPPGPDEAKPDAGAPPVSAAEPEPTRTVALEMDAAEADPAAAAAISPPAPPSPEARIADLAGQIAAILGEEVEPGHEPLRHAARLLALDLVSPGAAGAEVDWLVEHMVPAQVQTLEALRGLFRQLQESSPLDQQHLVRLLEAQIGALPRGRPLRIATLELCSSVERFGIYTPMEPVFDAGRAHEVVVYAEVENFNERRFDSARDGWSGVEEPLAERWVAELGQEITLRDDRNDHVALHESEQVIRDVARRTRRDFYTVQHVVLPAQLAIGKYHLKVTIRDLVDGAAVAEKVVPIEIVAP